MGNQLIVPDKQAIGNVLINSVLSTDGTICFNAGAPNMFPINTQVLVYLINKSIIIEDLSIYLTPFSIKAN
jgi:hypothetical protein